MIRIEKIAFEKGFFVTKEGIMYNSKNKETGHKCNSGYMRHTIRFGKVFKKFSVHRLQAYHKYGDEIYVKGIEVRHKNGNPSDNSFENILIGTHAENMGDIPEDVRMKNSLHATSFVRKYNKEEVRSFYKKEKSYLKTMEHFNMSSKGTLHFILNN